MAEPDKELEVSNSSALGTKALETFETTFAWFIFCHVGSVAGFNESSLLRGLVSCDDCDVLPAAIGVLVMLINCA